MILPSEIRKIAEHNGVPTSTIDKDWVLGHLLAEIGRHEWAQKNLLFKGGTCLKKCYFPDYRFSEDLDFTVLRKTFILEDHMIQDVCDMITSNTGILFAPATISRIIFKNKHLGYQTLIKFWGADHRRDQPPPTSFDRWHTSVKIEMTWHEIICFPVASLKLNDGYSDSLMLSDITLPSYMLSEIIAEKLRATIQRSYPAPRDYYDLWFLSKGVNPDNWPAIADAFRRKSEFKHVAFSNHLDFFEPIRLSRSERAWEHSLGKHLPTGQLPEFNRVIGDLKIKLQTVFG